MPARKVKLMRLPFPKETKQGLPCPGSKIRSGGAGRGKGYGKGKGPIGIPYKRKRL